MTALRALSTIATVIVCTSFAYAQGSLGEHRWESDVRDAWNKIRRMRMTDPDTGVNRGSDRNSYWGRSTESTLGAPNTPGSHRDLYLKKRLSGVRASKLRVVKARNKKKSRKVLGDAEDIYERAHPKWKELSEQYDPLHKRWKDLDKVIRDINLIINAFRKMKDTKLDDAIDADVKTLNALLKALREALNDLTMIYSGLYEPWKINQNMLSDDGDERLDQAQAYKARMQALDERLDNAAPKIKQAVVDIKRKTQEVEGKLAGFKTLVSAYSKELGRVRALDRLAERIANIKYKGPPPPWKNYDSVMILGILNGQKDADGLKPQRINPFTGGKFSDVWAMGEKNRNDIIRGLMDHLMAERGRLPEITSNRFSKYRCARIETAVTHSDGCTVMEVALKRQWVEITGDWWILGGPRSTNNIPALEALAVQKGIAIHVVVNKGDPVVLLPQTWQVRQKIVSLDPTFAFKVASVITERLFTSGPRKLTKPKGQKKGSLEIIQCDVGGKGMSERHGRHNYLRCLKDPSKWRKVR